MNGSPVPANDGRRRNHNRYIARFAGDVLVHSSDPWDGPTARRLISDVAWKHPPSASVRSEIST